MPVVKKNAVSPQTSTKIVEVKNLSKDESGNTGNGSEDGRAGERSSTGSDGGRSTSRGAIRYMLVNLNLAMIP
jgi:hypothetical protein